MKLKLLLPVFFIAAGLHAQNRFSKDLGLKIIYQHQYDLNTLALQPWLTHPEAHYREAAALAFASVQDSSQTETLFRMLHSDPEIRVRKAALYSLGQLRKQSISRRLIVLAGKKSYRLLKPELLMAIGKGAGRSELGFFVRFKPADSAQTRALVYAVFQAYRRSLSQGEAFGRLRDKLKNIQSLSHDASVHYMISVLLMPPRAVKPGEHVLSQAAPVFRKEQAATLAALWGGYYRLVDSLSLYQIDSASCLEMAFSSDLPHVLRNYCAERFLNTWHSGAASTALLLSRDVALVSLACGHIRQDTASAIRTMPGLQSLLMEARRTLLLPRDFEALSEIDKTLALLQRRSYPYQSWFAGGYRNPPDWAYIQNIPQRQKVRIHTGKGVVVLICHVNEAPVSVARFLRLADSGYYNGKYFHRMVPGFVVQGGCPRGDGWGALNWVQRSELSNGLQYTPGAVGLASAGKDSEGVQFFITHTWTPHLDGRYTLFAEVIEGMEVIGALEVGDLILKVERI